MPRYFFHLHDGPASVRDDEGVELADDAAALRHAGWCARSVIANQVLNGEPVRLASHISVANASGTEVGRVSFADAVRLDNGAAARSASRASRTA